MTFIPNPDNKPEVNHKDMNKLNNHVSNLEWVTPAENSRHHSINKPNATRGEKNGQCLYSDMQIYNTLVDININKMTITNTANKNNISYGVAKSIRYGIKRKDVYDKFMKDYNLL